MTTHYSLLGVEPCAALHEIKSAFRREVARYHPDKVQHLGPEFQEIATTRAAALTAAYRVLMDPELRARYDAQLASRGSEPAPDAAWDEREPALRHVPSAGPGSGTEAAAERRPAPTDGGALNVVRRAVLERLAEAAAASSGVAAPANGFDAAYQLKGRKGLFKRPEPEVRVAAQIVSRVDGPAVEAAWPAAARFAAGKNITTCLLLLGTGLSAAGELSAAISGLRRRTRGVPPLVIPIDIRDWQALVPPDTPSPVRGMLDRLRRPA